MRKLVLFTASAAGAGYSPRAPGTAGAGVGLGLYALLLQLPLRLEWTLPLVLAAVTAAGSWAAGQAEKLLGSEDDSRIAIDEVAGMLASLVLLPARLDVIAVGFLLFRVFDIFKPGPVRWAESLPGGFGVMADDLVAGICANGAGQLLWRLALPGGLL